MKLTKGSRFFAGATAWDRLSDFIYTNDELQTRCCTKYANKFNLRIKFTYEFAQNFLYEVRNLRIKTDNCTHVEIENGILEKRAVRNGYTEVKLTYQQRRRVPRSKREPLHENSLVFAFYNDDPHNNAPFQVDSIEILDELSLKRKYEPPAHPQNDTTIASQPVKLATVLARPENDNAAMAVDEAMSTSPECAKDAIARLPTLLDLSSVLDQDGSSSSGCGSMQRGSTSSSPGSFHNNEYCESPHKRVRIEQRLQWSKRKTFPSPNLMVLSQHGSTRSGGYVDLTKSSPRQSSLNSTQVLPCDPTLDSTFRYFLDVHWTVPPEQFNFPYFHFCYCDFLQQKRLRDDIRFTEPELIQKVGKYIKDQNEIAACPLCTDFFRIEELSEHTPMCCELDDLNTPSRTIDNSLTIIPDTSNHNASVEYVETTTPRGSPDVFRGIDIGQQNNNDLRDIIAVPIANTVGNRAAPNSPEIICVGDSDEEPQPIRTMYPHHDPVHDTDVQCPLCYMKFRAKDIERHSARCCDNMHTSQNIENGECYGSSSSIPRDHPSTYPSENRRVIKPRL